MGRLNHHHRLQEIISQAKIITTSPAKIITTSPAKIITTSPAKIITTSPAKIITTSPAKIITSRHRVAAAEITISRRVASRRARTTALKTKNYIPRKTTNTLPTQKHPRTKISQKKKFSTLAIMCTRTIMRKKYAMLLVRTWPHMIKLKSLTIKTANGAATDGQRDNSFSCPRKNPRGINSSSQKTRKTCAVVPESMVDFWVTRICALVPIVTA